MQVVGEGLHAADAAVQLEALKNLRVLLVQSLFVAAIVAPQVQRRHHQYK